MHSAVINVLNRLTELKRLSAVNNCNKNRTLNLKITLYICILISLFLSQSLTYALTRSLSLSFSLFLSVTHTHCRLVQWRVHQTGDRRVDGSVFTWALEKLLLFWVKKMMCWFTVWVPCLLLYMHALKDNVYTLKVL